ncbi:ead/Ea22-like family protein [Chitinilyticum litopenaei]|uniref:ead/Ea22-like family protein n=1 Tax=Chitinilyticum litopenaei TaxID=1121276 RepID=UPI0004134F8D|nr:ead/Ea22-like family protein [Chitinilyticum litopenaei]
MTPEEINELREMAQQATPQAFDTANPQAILALLDELERLQSELRDSTTLVFDLTAERDDLAAKLAALEQQEPVAYVSDAVAFTLKLKSNHATAISTLISCNARGDATVPLYAAPIPAPVADEREAFLLGGRRFKVSRHSPVDYGISGLPASLNGQWIALVDATNDVHMQARAALQPAQSA